MTAEEKTFTPTKYHPRSPNYNEHNQQVLGVLDFDKNFDNEFQEFKLVMKYVAETLEAIKQELIPLKKHDKMDLYPNKVAIDRLDKICQ